MEARGMTRIWIALLAGALAAGAAAPVAADDWEDARRDRLEEAVRGLEVEEVARQRGTTPDQVRNSVMSLRHGKVVMVADLARADLTLEIRNTGTQPMEWSRAFAIDPLAEAIGASLQRGDTPPEVAQTLTLADARRIYAEVRDPRPTRTVPAPRQRTGGDPLRVERPSRARMNVVVWPIAPGETVRVALTFVSPLRGRGERRTYVDPIQGDAGSVPTDDQPVTTEPDARRTPILASMDTDWLVDTGDLALSGVPTGMVAAGEAGGLLHFRGPERPEQAGKPSLPLRVLRPSSEVLAVHGGGLGTRVAVFHFDPIAFLEEHDLAGEVSPDCTLRIRRRAGSTSRIAPWVFPVTAEPRPVTARLFPQSPDLRYAVEVVDAQGDVLHRFEVERGVNRTTLDAARAGAITGWHRAALAARVRDWAGNHRVKQQEALDFAVDLGVLTAGTAALAVPPAERSRLRVRSRRQYFSDGAPLGAQDREADFRGPPSRSTAK